MLDPDLFPGVGMVWTIGHSPGDWTYESVALHGEKVAAAFFSVQYRDTLTLQL